MKVWQLISPNNLQHADISQHQPILIPARKKLSSEDSFGLSEADEEKAEKKVKIKILRAILTEEDVALYSGAFRAKYPIIPGRIAIGSVADDESLPAFRKGERVYICNVHEDECAENGLQIAGEDTDGFFCDFVNADFKDVYPLPPVQEISRKDGKTEITPFLPDKAAFLIDAVAMAERLVEELHFKAGDHILVVGGGIYGNILCQCLLRYQAVPILADNNEERLFMAEKSGIDHRFPYDETLKENIFRITGGHMADAAVYFASVNKNDASYLFSLVGREKTVIFCSSKGKNVSVNLENALKNNLTIKGVSEAHHYISKAIEILTASASSAVAAVRPSSSDRPIDFSAFTCNLFSEERLPDIFKIYSDYLFDGDSLPEDMKSLPNSLNIFKFLF